MNTLFTILLFAIISCVIEALPVWSEENFEHPIYPFQQYIQVRKSYRVEHLPSYSHQQPTGRLHPSVETIESAATDHNGGSGNGENYHSPRLTEEVQTWEKQEVYEEKGYSDSAYEHENEGKSHSSDHHTQSTRKYPQYQTLAENIDGSSSNLLHHAANVLYDSDAHHKGIYEARSGIYCPPVIDFDISSKSMKIGKAQERPAGKPRLSGLGSKIRCLRRKYFGQNPFPAAIFKQPEESKKSLINGGSMQQFMQDFNKRFPA